VTRLRKGRVTDRRERPAGESVEGPGQAVGAPDSCSRRARWPPPYRKPAPRGSGPIWWAA